jgi:hypothetical protein
MKIFSLIRFIVDLKNVILAISLTIIPVGAYLISGEYYELLSSQSRILDNAEFTRFGKVNGDNFLLTGNVENIYKIHHPERSSLRKDVIPANSSSAIFLPRALWLEQMKQASYSNTSIINQSNTVRGDYHLLTSGDIAISTQFMHLHHVDINDQLYVYASLEDEPTLYTIRFIFHDFLFTLSNYYQGIIPYQGTVLFGGDDVPDVPMNRTDYLYYGQIQDNFSSNTFLIVKVDLMKGINLLRNEVVSNWNVIYSIYFVFACFINLKMFNALDSMRSLKRMRSKSTFLYVFFESVSVLWLSLLTTIVMKIITMNSFIDAFIFSSILMMLLYTISVSILLNKEFNNGELP